MSYQTHVGLRISTQAGAVPTAEQIGEGELAFNLADRRIFARFGDTVDDITDHYTRAEADQVTQDLSDRLDDLAIGDIDGLFTALASKVNKEEGKGLSSNDYTDSDQAKVAAVGTMANRAVYISSEPPDDAVGNDGDIWLQHWS